MKRQRGLIPVALLCLSGCLNAQPWSGIISSSRAIDWTSAGVSGGIPSASWVQCGPTIPVGASAAAINAAIQACSANHFLLLDVGTFNLTAGVIMKTGVEVRGAGAFLTQLVFTGTTPCNGANAVVCFNGGIQYYGSATTQPGRTYAATWTAGYAQGETSITLANVGSSGILNGQMIILDQLDDTAVSSGLFVCQTDASTPACSNQTNNVGRGSGTRSQAQIVQVTAGCASSCIGVGPFTLTISPGLRAPNWASGYSPGAWWISGSISNSGVRNLSLDSTNSGGQKGIQIGSGAVNVWVAGVRHIRSCSCSRDSIAIEQSARITIQDNYFYGNGTGSMTNYAIEQMIASDVLIQNNIFQMVNVPTMMGTGTSGSVVAYNFMVHNITSPTGWFSAAIWEHDAEVNYSLYEGNSGLGLTADTYHGNSNFNTAFRNRWPGTDAGKNNNQAAVALWSYNRYHNFVGNVLGDTSAISSYQSQAGNGGNGAVYNLGGGNAGPPSNVSTDSEVASGALRWGNYDTVTGAVRWCGNSSDTGWSTTCASTSEVPTGLAAYANSVPASETLPASFYLTSKPSWWPSTKAWPPIGPDVTGGNVANVGGHANTIPAQDCYLNVMQGPPDGTGNVLNFDASLCYASYGTRPASPTGLTVKAQ